MNRIRKYLHDARTFPGDAANAWRRERFGGVCEELAQRSAYRLVRWSRSLVLEQELAWSTDAPPPAGIEIRQFSGPDWARMAPLASLRTRTIMAMASARGRTLLVAWRGAAPVGYAWCSERMERDIETFPLPLPSDAAYLWGLYTPPAERCRGIGTALARARLQWARDQGYRLAWRVIAVHNAASFRTAEKSSGRAPRILGELRSLKLLWLRSMRYRAWERPLELTLAGPVVQATALPDEARCASGDA